MNSIAAVTMTPDERVVAVLLAALFGWFGWRMSRTFRAASGVTPWHLPSGIWAAICFMFNVLGLLLVLIAQFTTRGALGGPSPQRGPAWIPFGRPRGLGGSPLGASGGTGLAPRQRSGSGRSWPGVGPGEPRGPAPDTPGRPGATDGRPQHPDSRPLDAGALAPDPTLEAPPRRFPPPLPEPDGRSALFGWYPDVTGRHERRYYDGRDWTAFVHDGEVSSTDPL